MQVIQAGIQSTTLAMVVVAFSLIIVVPLIYLRYGEPANGNGGEDETSTSTDTDSDSIVEGSQDVRTNSDEGLEIQDVRVDRDLGSVMTVSVHESVEVGDSVRFIEEGGRVATIHVENKSVESASKGQIADISAYDLNPSISAVGSTLTVESKPEE